MNQQPATKRPKFCPLCQKKGLNSKLKLHQLNFVEAIYMCPNSECLFPLQGGLAESFLVKRPINVAQDFPAAAINPPENPVFPGLPQPENIDNSFINQLIEPSTSQSCENNDTDIIFDLDNWLENLGNDPPLQQPEIAPRGLSKHKEPEEPNPPNAPKTADAPEKTKEITCIKSVAYSNNTRQLSETTKEVKTPCNKTKRKNVANASPTKLMTTDIVAATQLQFPQKCDVIVENRATAEKTVEKRPVNSANSISVPSSSSPNQNYPKTYSKPRVQDATKKQSAISLNVGLLLKSKGGVTRKLSTQSEPPPQRNAVTKPKVVERERSQPVNNFLPSKSMSLKEIINSVTIKKRPQFFVEGGVGGGSSTRAEKRKMVNLRGKLSPPSQVTEVFSGKPAKRRKLDPVANEVPVSLKKVHGKFRKTLTMYEGYGVSSKIGPEDETASEDSGIQSPNSVASAGSGSLSGSLSGSR